MHYSTTGLVFVRGRQSDEVNWCRLWYVKTLHHGRLRVTCQLTLPWQQFSQFSAATQCSASVTTTDCRRPMSDAELEQQLCAVVLSRPLSLAHPAGHQQPLTQTDRPTNNLHNRTLTCHRLRSSGNTVAMRHMKILTPCRFEITDRFQDCKCVSE